jgi:hypothetical protein
MKHGGMTLFTPHGIPAVMRSQIAIEADRHDGQLKAAKKVFILYDRQAKRNGDVPHIKPAEPIGPAL